jgi:hypothetical protein
MYIQIVSPYHPQVRSACQTGSCRRVIEVDPHFQIKQIETQTKTYRAAQRQ